MKMIASFRVWPSSTFAVVLLFLSGFVNCAAMAAGTQHESTTSAIRMRETNKFLRLVAFFPAILLFNEESLGKHHRHGVRKQYEEMITWKELVTKQNKQSSSPFSPPSREEICSQLPVSVSRYLTWERERVYKTTANSIEYRLAEKQRNELCLTLRRMNYRRLSARSHRNKQIDQRKNRAQRPMEKQQQYVNSSWIEGK